MSFPASTGAMCARHPERAASGTCERCGNFTCDECYQGHTLPLCPACREKLGPGGFTLRRDSWTFDALWSHVWEAFKRDWVLLSVAVLIFLGVNGVVSAIGGVLQEAMKKSGGTAGLVMGFLAVQVGQLIVQGIFELGLYRMYLDVVEGGKADISRIASQVSKLGRYIVQKLLVLVLLGVPLGLYLLLVFALAAGSAGFKPAAIEENPSAIGIIAIGVLLAIVPIFYFALPLYFSTPELAHNEGVGPFQSIKNCFEIARGQRLIILGISLLSGLIAIAGVLVCCIGVLPAVALGQMLVTGLYLTLRNGTGLPLAREERHTPGTG
ncbi:MAG: hypothetical protein HYZ28_10660 [Myxococcales bacterium]|nr:hypothetical protein [Myxococcales bacterium]